MTRPPIGRGPRRSWRPAARNRIGDDRAAVAGDVDEAGRVRDGLRVDVHGGPELARGDGSRPLIAGRDADLAHEVGGRQVVGRRGERPGPRHGPGADLDTVRRPVEAGARPDVVGGRAGARGVDRPAPTVLDQGQGGQALGVTLLVGGGAPARLARAISQTRPAGGGPKSQQTVYAPECRQRPRPSMLVPVPPPQAVFVPPSMRTSAGATTCRLVPQPAVASARLRSANGTAKAKGAKPAAPACLVARRRRGGSLLAGRKRHSTQREVEAAGAG